MPPHLPGVADDRRGLPRYWGPIHASADFDEFAGTVFQLRDKLPPRRGSARSRSFGLALDSILGAAIVQAHQSLYLFPSILDKTLATPQFYVWDLSDESTYELVVSGFLARLGALPQALHHLRKSIELTLLSGFCNVVTTNVAGNVERPFLSIYESGLWEYYASNAGSVGSSNVKQRAKKAEVPVRRSWRRFGEFYAAIFSSPLCQTHWLSLQTKHRRKGMAVPVGVEFPEADPSPRPCKVNDCGRPGTIGVFEKLPTFELMIEVLSAALWSRADSGRQAARASDIYGMSSRAVHATRGVHVHGPGWDPKGTKAFVRVLRQGLQWSMEAQSILWRRNNLEIPALGVYLKSIGYDLSAVSPGRVETAVGRLLKASVPEPTK